MGRFFQLTGLPTLKYFILFLMRENKSATPNTNLCIPFLLCFTTSLFTGAEICQNLS